MIEPGTPAPDFSLPDQDGNQVSLASLRGQTVVLAFYPLDFSPVCTDQLSVYQEVLPELEARGVRLYGVSVDSAFAHKAFQRELGITIPLLADFHPKGEVARRFGVYNQSYGTARRALVMIGPDGIVRWSHVSPSPLDIPGINLVFDALEHAEAAWAPAQPEPRREQRARPICAARHLRHQVRTTTSADRRKATSSSSTPTSSAPTAREATSG
jgi:peroxiredoxin